MMDLQFVDVGEEGLPEGYLAAALPRLDTCGQHFMVFEDEFELIPRDQWPALIEQQEPLEMLIQRTKDQGREGSCCPNAACGAFEVIWNLTFGPANWLEFSPISMYRWLSPGPGTGVYIPEAMRQMVDVGLLPCDTPKNRSFLAAAGLPENHVLLPTGYSQRFPAGWEATAQHLRLAEAWDIRTFDGIVSASLEGYTVVYGRAGHAVFCVRIVRRGGAYFLRYWNSWNGWGEVGLNGLQGAGHDSEEFVSGAIKGYGAFAIRTPLITSELIKAIETTKFD